MAVVLAAGAEEVVAAAVVVVLAELSWAITGEAISMTAAPIARMEVLFILECSCWLGFEKK